MVSRVAVGRDPTCAFLVCHRKRSTIQSHEEEPSRGSKKVPFFVYPSDKDTKKSTTLPERKLYMLHYWDTKNHQVHLVFRAAASFYAEAKKLMIVLRNASGGFSHNPVEFPHRSCLLKAADITLLTYIFN
jgi:hypothetical protein